MQCKYVLYGKFGRAFSLNANLVHMKEQNGNVLDSKTRNLKIIVLIVKSLLTRSVLCDPF